VAYWRPPEISPWRRRGLTIPPDSLAAWVRLGTWEFSMGVLLYIVVGFDFTNCYAVPPVAQPCERIAYRAGVLNAMMNGWCGLLLIAVAAWLVWELWSAAAPKPITDDFLKLLDDSFGYSWRRPRSWPLARMAWAYGFALAGICSAVVIGLVAAAEIAKAAPAKAPTVHVETSLRFRLSP
jgi:hypothetical protein